MFNAGKNVQKDDEKSLGDQYLITAIWTEFAFCQKPKVETWFVVSDFIFGDKKTV